MSIGVFCFLFLGLISQDSFSQIREHSIAEVFQKDPELYDYLKEIQSGIQKARSLSIKEGSHFDLVSHQFHSGNEKELKKILKSVGERWLIAGKTSEEAILIAEEVKSRGLFVISPSATSPLIQKKFSHVIQVAGTDDALLERLMNWLQGQKNIKSVGVLHRTNNVFSDELAAESLSKIKKMGKMATEFRYANSGGKMNFDTAVKQFQKNQVDLVLSFGWAEELEAWLKASQDYAPMVVGTDGWGDGADLKDVVAKYPYKGELKQLLFRSPYLGKYGIENRFEALGFEAYYALNEARKNNPKATSDQIFEKLKKNLANRKEQFEWITVKNPLQKN